jgi:hypothetical protein
MWELILSGLDVVLLALIASGFLAADAVPMALHRVGPVSLRALLRMEDRCAFRRTCLT